MKLRCGTAKESKSDTPETVEEQDNSCYRCEFVGKTKAGLKTHITATHEYERRDLSHRA